jgi:hypothetical protein
VRNRFGWNFARDKFFHPALERPAGTDLYSRGINVGGVENAAAADCNAIGEKRTSQGDAASDGKFAAGDRVKLGVDAGADLELGIGNIELAGESRAVTQDDFGSGQNAGDFHFAADEKTGAFKTLYLDFGTALETNDEGMKLTGNLGALDSDDFLGGAEFAENLAANFDPSAGGFDALEGTALGEEDFVIGVKFAGLDAADDLVASRLAFGARTMRDSRSLPTLK